VGKALHMMRNSIGWSPSSYRLRVKEHANRCRRKSGRMGRPGSENGSQVVRRSCARTLACPEPVDGGERAVTGGGWAHEPRSGSCLRRGIVERA